MPTHLLRPLTTVPAIGALLLAMASLAASGATQTFKGADLSDPSLALYVEASYKTPEGKSNAPLVLQQAKVLLLTSATSEAAGYQRIELSCRHNEALARSENAQRYVQGLEGTALWLDCQPGEQAAFLPKLVFVTRETQRLGIEMPARCDKPGPLNTLRVATFPIGHQELCLEDWSGLRDPRRRFVDEYVKRHEVR